MHFVIISSWSKLSSSLHNFTSLYHLHLRLPEVSSPDHDPGASSGPLLSIGQVPAHLRFNKWVIPLNDNDDDANTTTFRYVHSHYRPPLDTVGCVASLLYWHNETVNVLTHFIPVIIITGRG